MNNARIIVGLAYGDEGKGTMTDYLCREYSAGLVIRYNGGSQAAHNVITDDGVHHTFAQIGSGTFVPGVKTLLSKYMLWDPIALAHEVAEVSEKVGEHVLNRHFIDGRAPVITPFHIATNCLKEWIRGGGRHGSCGKGIGETAYDLVYHNDEVIRAEDLFFPGKVEAKLKLICKRKFADMAKFGADLGNVPDHLRNLAGVFTRPDEIKKIAYAYRAMAHQYNILGPQAVGTLIRDEEIIMEGAQGVLLDEWHGFHPHTTWSTITQKNAIDILDEAGFAGTREVVGIARAFLTRHVAGPFVTEVPSLRHVSPGEHNGRNEWQGNFRVGGFDCVKLRYAMECLRHIGEVDSIALTHLDIVERAEIPVCVGYAMDKDLDNAMDKAPSKEIAEGKGNTVNRIIPNYKEDLVHQEAITDMLFKAHPIQGRPFTSPADVVERVEEITGVPVRYTSSGPQTKDKATCVMTA